MFNHFSTVRLRNRKSGEVMARVFVTAQFRKPCWFVDAQSEVRGGAAAPAGGDRDPVMPRPQAAFPQRELLAPHLVSPSSRVTEPEADVLASAAAASQQGLDATRWERRVIAEGGDDEGTADGVAGAPTTVAADAGAAAAPFEAAGVAQRPLATASSV